MDNDTHRIESVRLGVPGALPAGTSGTLHFDAFESRRSTYIGQAGMRIHYMGKSMSKGGLMKLIAFVPDVAGRYAPLQEEIVLDAPTDYLFNGKHYEQELGLYWFESRWYDPALNRWIQPDNIIPDPGNLIDFDRYAFNRNNPTRYIDPSGNRPCDDVDKNGSWDSEKGWLRKLKLSKSEAEGEFLKKMKKPSRDSEWGPFAGCNTVSDSPNPCNEGWHPGIDTRGNNSWGVPIYAAEFGKVAYVGIIEGFGQYIVVEHTIGGNNFYSVYAHLDTFSVQVGDIVGSDTQIGTMGGTSGLMTDPVTGNSVADQNSVIDPHLHFEVRKSTNVNGAKGVGGKNWWPTSRQELQQNFVDLSLLPWVELSPKYDKMP